MICVSFSKPMLEDFLSIHPEVRLVELRLDLMTLSDVQIQHFFSLSIDIVATCRPNKSITERQRLEWLRKCIKAGAVYVDVEIENKPEFIAEIRQLAGDCGCKLIISHHNFKKTPKLAELEEIKMKCIAEKADIIKIACMINDDQNLLTIKSLYSGKHPIIALGMGEKGTITRIKACEWGAPFTFAAAYPDEITASGQLDYETLCKEIE